MRGRRRCAAFVNPPNFTHCPIIKKSSCPSAEEPDLRVHLRCCLPADTYRSMTWSSRWTRTICGNYGAVLLSYYPFWVLTILPRFTFIFNVSGRVCGVAFGQQLNMCSRDLRRLKKHYFYKYKTETAGLQRIYVMGFTLTGNARRKLAVQVCRREGWWLGRSVTCLRDERNMGSTAYIYPLTDLCDLCSVTTGQVIRWRKQHLFETLTLPFFVLLCYLH